MQQPNWVPATDFALGDEIRFEQRIRDEQRRAWASAHQTIQGTIVQFSPKYVTLSTSTGLLRKKVTTIKKGSPERLDREGRIPTVWFAKASQAGGFEALDEDLAEDLAYAIAKDDERDRRLARESRDCTDTR